MAHIERFADKRHKQRTPPEPVMEPVSSVRPQRELVLEGLLATGLRVRIWSVAQPLAPAQV